MGRLLRIQDRILLVLADMGDLFETARDPGGISGNYYQIVYGWVPYRYRKSNFKRRVRRMLKVGYIEKIVKNGQPYLRLTSQGRKRIVRDFPLLALREKKWSEIGTLVSFDIKEVEKTTRVKFRRLLLNAGAGQVQRSVYAFAYDLRVEVMEIIETLGLEESVKVFPITFDCIKDKEEFARRVWKLDNLEEAYQGILDKFEELEEKKGREYEQSVREIRDSFLNAITSDPFLPKAFLPKDWVGNKVQKLMKKLR